MSHRNTRISRNISILRAIRGGSTLRAALAALMVALALTGAASSGAAAGARATAESSTAAAPSADLAVSGFVAGGERAVETSHPVVFVISLTNNGPGRITSSADLNWSAVRNGSVTDTLCITPEGSSLNSDGSFCEPGGLRVGQTSKMTLIVQPSAAASGQRLSVKVCGSNESGVPDPVSANDCRTFSVALE